MKRIYCLILLMLLGSTVMFAQKKAKIEFTETRYEFGEFSEKEGDVSHVFTFVNTGDAPLIITRAAATCGCTKPEYPAKPIAPGKKGEIKVTYQAEGRPGKFQKNVYVYSNGDPDRVVLVISGIVDPKN